MVDASATASSHHITIFTAAVHRLADGAASDSNKGLSGNLGCGIATLTSTKHILHRAAAHGNVGVARNSTQLTTAVHIIINSAVADIDNSTRGHVSVSTEATAKDVGDGTAININGSGVINSTLGIGTAIDISFNLTVIHGNVDVLAFLHIGTAKHRAFHRTTQNINV